MRSVRDAGGAARSVAAGTGKVSRVDGHRVEVEWMGSMVPSLEDLLRPGLLAVVVGINPAPASVAAGHYWQGNTGRTLWRRLAAVGLMPPGFDGREDDAAFESGVGFTDVVKRPTPSADDLDRVELEFGRHGLESKLESIGAPLVIFAFKRAAITLLGPFPGNGFVDGLALDRSLVFVMPGPYEAKASADSTLDELRHWVESQRP